MKKSDSLPINKKKSKYDNKIYAKASSSNNYFSNLSQMNISADYFKIFAIIILLTSSIIMYNYEPSSIINRVNNNTGNLNNKLQNEETDDNPYGFQPFYQVHKRIQYKNPKANPCHGIEPSKTILFAILSRASNAHIREAIRQTWGAIRVYNGIEIRLSFIVGVDDGMLKQIEIEQAIYHGKF
jgi:hypothetical protein